MCHPVFQISFLGHSCENSFMKSTVILSLHAMLSSTNLFVLLSEIETFESLQASISSSGDVAVLLNSRAWNIVSPPIKFVASEPNRINSYGPFETMTRHNSSCTGLSGKSALVCEDTCRLYVSFYLFSLPRGLPWCVRSIPDSCHISERVEHLITCSLSRGLKAHAHV